MSYSIRWLGHATFHIVTEAGTHIYLDPWITGNPVCPVALDSIERADIVCVTHGHSDHIGDALDLVRLSRCQWGRPMSKRRVLIAGAATIPGTPSTNPACWHHVSSGQMLCSSPSRVAAET